MPAGFQKTIGPNVVTFERSWTYQDISPRTKASTCFYRAVSISVTSEAGARQSITVQNWKEPGC
jgi:hypothetical protein